jgi:phage terminase large subunit GpA-like protein
MSIRANGTMALNTGLDTLVIAVACAFHPLIRIDRLRAQNLNAMQAKLQPREVEKQTELQATPAAKTPFVKAPAIKKVGGFVRNW